MAYQANQSQRKQQEAASRFVRPHCQKTCLFLAAYPQLAASALCNMISEELRIRRELEKDVERELEEEIKDEICRLALRLHRLYQQQKERNATELFNNGMKADQRGTKKNIRSEDNKNIKMEGETRIEIKEIKKQAPQNRGRINPKTGIKQGMVAPKSKKFDWVKSLRSGPNPVSVDSKIDSSCQCKIQGNQAKTGKNASQQHMVNKGDKNMLLELGWKD